MNYEKICDEILEFNEKMLNFYTSHNHQEMTLFMLSCLDDKVIEIMGV